MTVDSNSIDLSSLMTEHLERAEPDLLRSILKTFVNALMPAEVDAIWGTLMASATRNGRPRRPDCRTVAEPDIAVAQVRAVDANVRPAGPLLVEIPDVSLPTRTGLVSACEARLREWHKRSSEGSPCRGGVSQLGRLGCPRRAEAASGVGTPVPRSRCPAPRRGG